MARALGAGRVLGTVGSEAKRAYALRHGYDDVWLREGWLERVRAVAAAHRRLEAGRTTGKLLLDVGGVIAQRD